MSTGENLLPKGISLEKVLIEVRYDRSFLFDEVATLNKIAKVLKPYFPIPDRDNDKTLVLKNQSKNYFSLIQANRASVDFDLPKSLEDFKTVSSQSIEALINHLDVDGFKRVGIRFLFGKTFSSIEEAYSIIKNRFLSTGNILDEIKSPNISFVLRRDDSRVNVMIRTETVTNINISIGQNNEQTQERVNNDMIVFDIDVYKQGRVTIDQYNDFYNEAQNTALNVLDQLNSMIEV